MLSRLININHVRTFESLECIVRDSKVSQPSDWHQSWVAVRCCMMSCCMSQAQQIGSNWDILVFFAALAVECCVATCHILPSPARLSSRLSALAAFHNFHGLPLNMLRGRCVTWWDITWHHGNCCLGKHGGSGSFWISAIHAASCSYSLLTSLISDWSPGLRILIESLEMLKMQSERVESILGLDPISQAGESNINFKHRNIVQRNLT
jgi:hypothetical protein